MNKKIIAPVFGLLLFSCVVSRALYAADYWTGDGGRGKSLAVMAPEGKGLSKEDQTLPILVQSYFNTTMETYSDIEIKNRMNAENILRERELQEDSSVRDIGEALKTDYLLLGTITRTSSAFAFNINITRVQDTVIAASHSGTYTREEIENQIAVNKATLDLLGKMGVTLTALAKAELQQAANQQAIQGQRLLTDGILAERGGNTIAAQFAYYQAAEIDPSLMEAANRASIVSRNISTGNIGQDRLNDIQWREAWLKRLTETEQYFDNYFKTLNQPYALIWTDDPKYGATDYNDNTLPVSITVELREMSNWTDPVRKTLNDVWQGLNATGMKAAWGFADWPRSRVSKVGSFLSGSKRLRIAVELVNDKQKVIGRETFEVRGSWDYSFSRDTGIQSFTSSGEKEQTITFHKVKVEDLPPSGGTMAPRFVTVNGVPAAEASKNGVLMITPRDAYRDGAGFDYYGGGYGWDGFNKNGLDKDGFDRAGYKGGYDREGFDRDGYNSAGYSRAGFDRNGFNKEGLTANGTPYDNAGYNREGYSRDGYNRNGFNRNGRTRDGSLYNASGYDKDGFNAAGFNRSGYDREGYNREGYNKGGYDKKGYGRDGYHSVSGVRRWRPWPTVPGSTTFEAMLTLRMGDDFYPGLTVGLLGAYGSFALHLTESDKPADTSANGTSADEETTSKDTQLAEFVAGYTVNLQSKRGREFHSGWGLPLGVGYNFLEDQLILEAGLQLRGFKSRTRKAVGIELRATYRLIGFKDSGFTISVGWW